MHYIDLKIIPEFNDEKVVTIWVLINSKFISGKLLDYDEDPLQLEPNIRKRIKNGVTSYPCDKCDYAATTAKNLKRHIESKHDGVRYPCDKCEYAATWKGNLKKHLNKFHN